MITEKIRINDNNFKKLCDTVAGENLIYLTGFGISITLNMKNWKALFDTS